MCQKCIQIENAKRSCIVSSSFSRATTRARWLSSFTTQESAVCRRDPPILFFFFFFFFFDRSDCALESTCICIFNGPSGWPLAQQRCTSPLSRGRRRVRAGRETARQYIPAHFDVPGTRRICALAFFLRSNSLYGSYFVSGADDGDEKIWK